MSETKNPSCDMRNCMFYFQGDCLNVDNSEKLKPQFKWHKYEECPYTKQKKMYMEIIDNQLKRIEKMKCCENCKYGHCGWSSESIIDEKKTMPCLE